MLLISELRFKNVSDFMIITATAKHDLDLSSVVHGLFLNTDISDHGHVHINTLKNVLPLSACCCRTGD